MRSRPFYNCQKLGKGLWSLFRDTGMDPFFPQGFGPRPISGAHQREYGIFTMHFELR